MRAVLSTFGSNSDAQLMLALGAELLHAGHQPILALSPSFADRARKLGMEFVPLGSSVTLERTLCAVDREGQRRTPTDRIRQFLEATLPALPGTCEVLRELCRNSDVLIGSPYQPAGSIVHETTSIPYASLHFSRLAEVGGKEMREMSASLINPYRIREGVSPVNDPLGPDGNSDQLALYAVSRHFLQPPAQWPDHYKVVGFFFHDEKDWRPQRGLEEFCSSGEPPVVVTFGSVVHSDPVAVTDLLLAAAQQAKCRMIIQRGWGGLGKDAVPARVLVTGLAPHAWLFPRAALIVHHGSAGTTASTLRSGIPAVAVPHMLDQPIWAGFARAQGCVRNVIPFALLNADRLATAIRNAMASPQLREAAAAFGKEIRAETGVQTARKLIEDFVANRQHPMEVFQATEAKQIQLPPLVAVPRREEMPLSYAQQRLWFADQLEKGSTAYNMRFQWRFEGKMRPSALQRVLNHMVQRHEILRTTFPMRNGKPVQKIAREMELVLEEIDLQSFSPEEREAEVRRIANEKATLAFDLTQGPLWRMSWLRLDASTHVLLGNVHHIVSDGWSQEIMSREIGQLYKAYVQNEVAAMPQLNIQYADYAVWQREQFSGEAMEEQLAYWRKQLDGLPVLELPTDYPRPAIRSQRGGSTRYQFSGELTEKLKALSRRESATVFMIVLAAFQILLSKYSGQEDIAVGTPIAGRTRKELEGVIGCFINMLTMRTDLSGNPSFGETIRRARQGALEAYRHQDVPFERVVQELHTERDVSRTPLFQVMLVFQSAEMVRPQLEDLRFTGLVDLNESAPFDLTLDVLESRGTRCRLSYASDLYSSETASRMLQHLNRLLENMVATPELKVADFTWLTQAELHQVLVEWNGVDLPYSREQCVHELFEQQVNRDPSAVSVEYEGQSLTYGELNFRANQMAHYLSKLGIGPETPVALCMERRLELMIGILAILKAGGAYVPLDPSLPRERLKWILKDIDPRVALTQTEVAKKLQTRGHVVCVDDPGMQQIFSREPQTNLGPRAEASNAVYIIYTSGSTGRPKAVVAAHNGLVNLAQFQQKAFGVTPLDRVLQFLAPSFDPAIGDWATTLLAGATLVLSPDPRRMLGSDLAELLETRRVSYAGLSPSILTSLPDVQLRGLRVLLTGGAPCSAELMHQWSKRREMFNVYGPTETTICATLTRLSDVESSVSIGRPIGNVQVFVLNKDMNPAPVGMRGELYIGGVGVSRGYWKRPDLTADRFVPNKFSHRAGERLYRTGDIVRWRTDRKLEFVGRADEQIKIREQRIELGEIEAVLRQRKEVRDALVIAREDQTSEKRLVAYIVPEKENSKGLLAGELRAALREELPAYMVPSHFVILNALPITASGKIDRRELPAPAEVNSTPGPIVTDALTEVERKIANVWSEVLQVKKVGVHDNFFELGGDSFQSIRVQSELVQIFGRDIKVLELFRFPTVRSLAEYLTQPTTEAAPVKNDLPPASLDAGRKRLQRQLAQRIASKRQRAAVSP